MINSMRLTVGWNPAIQKYQSTVIIMFNGELQTYERNQTQQENEKIETGNYQGAKSALQQYHLETENLEELFEKLKSIGRVDSIPKE